MTSIDLTASESATWARMPEEDRELMLAALGAMLRAWAKWHPRAPVIQHEAPPAPVLEQPPPRVTEPDDVELYEQVRDGRYGPRPARAVAIGHITVDNVRSFVARLLRPGLSAEEPPTEGPMPTTG